MYELTPTANPNEADIVDETLDLFRANSLFRNFEIKGAADRLLIVLILFISDCLAKIAAAKTVPAKIEAGKLLNTLAVDTFPLPGDVGFALNAHYAAPSNRVDAGESGVQPPRSSRHGPRCCRARRKHLSTHLNIYFILGRSAIIRFPPELSRPSTPRTRCETRRTIVCRWDRQTKQVVDVFHKATIHES